MLSQFIHADLAQRECRPGADVTAAPRFDVMMMCTPGAPGLQLVSRDDNYRKPVPTQVGSDCSLELSRRVRVVPVTIDDLEGCRRRRSASECQRRRGCRGRSPAGPG